MGIQPFYNEKWENSAYQNTLFRYVTSPLSGNLQTNSKQISFYFLKGTGAEFRAGTFSTLFRKSQSIL